MKRDIIIGVVVAIGLHAGFIFGGDLFKGAPEVKAKVEEVPVVELMQMPPVEPETPPEPVEATPGEAVSDISDMAPPSLNDSPSIVESPFQQQIQAPVPLGLSRPTGSVIIPAGRPASVVGSGMSNVFDLASLDQQPVPRVQAGPQYPIEMKRAGIKGEVLVGFIVDASGDVRDAFAVRSTQREFENEAVKAVMKWKFKPGKKGGTSVNTRMQVPIAFTLSKS